MCTPSHGKRWHTMRLLPRQENCMADRNFSIMATHAQLFQQATLSVTGLRWDGPFVVSCACAQCNAWIISYGLKSVISGIGFLQSCIEFPNYIPQKVYLSCLHKICRCFLPKAHRTVHNHKYKSYVHFLCLFKSKQTPELPELQNYLQTDYRVTFNETV